MAKQVILSCEIDGDIDSAENRVVTANVCGHRVELCRVHRVELLTLVGVSKEHAEAYVAAYDRQAGRKGTNPTMAQVLEDLAAAEDEGQAPVVDAEPATEALVEAPAAEETVEEPAPSKRRK